VIPVAGQSVAKVTVWKSTQPFTKFLHEKRDGFGDILCQRSFGHSGFRVAARTPPEQRKMSYFALEMADEIG
jgi:hypothetical protein